MGAEQKADLLRAFESVKNAGDLDFVAAWFKKSSDYMAGSKVKSALVSTNSIAQGQSVSILWKHLLVECKIHIDFAYRTFKWNNESRNQAAVHCVIIGFSAGGDSTPCLLIDEKGQHHQAAHINGYLTAAQDIFIENRTKPLCEVPEIGMGNQPIDDGLYLFTNQEKQEFLKRNRRLSPISNNGLEPRSLSMVKSNFAYGWEHAVLRN